MFVPSKAYLLTSSQVLSLGLFSRLAGTLFDLDAVFILLRRFRAQGCQVFEIILPRTNVNNVILAVTKSAGNCNVT